MNNKKSCSLKEKITKSLNINYSKCAKFFLLIPVIIIAIPIAFTSVFGLNYSDNITGRYEVTVNFGVELNNDKITEYVDKISDALDENNMTMKSYVKSGQSIYNKIVVTIDGSFDKLDDEEAENIRIAIENNLKSSIDSTIEVQELQFVAQSINASILKAVICLVVALVAVFIYLWIRYNISVATSIITASVISAGLIYSIYAICRIPFDSFAIANMFVALIITTLVSIMAFNTIKNNELSGTSLTNDQYIVDANALSINSVICPLSFVICVLVIISFVMLFINVSLFLNTIALCIALIIAIYCALYCATSLWSIMYNKDKDQRLKNRIEKAKHNEEKKSNKKKDKNEENDKILV